MSVSLLAVRGYRSLQNLVLPGQTTLDRAAWRWPG
jgi:hypothetical protein